MKNILENALKNSISYQDYRNLIHQLLAEELTNYSLLNEARMKRLDKTIEIEDEIIAEFQKIDETQKWLVITESWCGDAAQNLYVMKIL